MGLEQEIFLNEFQCHSIFLARDVSPAKMSLIQKSKSLCGSLCQMLALLFSALRRFDRWLIHVMRPMLMVGCALCLLVLHSVGLAITLRRNLASYAATHPLLRHKDATKQCFGLPDARAVRGGTHEAKEIRFKHMTLSFLNSRCVDGWRSQPLTREQTRQKRERGTKP